MKKNTITLTEQQLNEIIYNAINNYINDCNNNIGNLKIDGDIPDLRDTIGSYADEFFLKRHLKEGLVRTFPCENVKNMLCRKFSLQKNQVQNETRNFNGADITLLTVVLTHNVSSSVLGEIKHFMRTCGYFPIRDFEIHPQYTQLGTITFEPKFTKEISTEIRNKCQYLYHSTSTTLVNKIRRNGLVPKSGNSLFMYPDRVYCMEGDVLTDVQKQVLKNVQDARNSTNPSARNPNDKLEYSLITIDVSKIPQNVKMYYDPMSPNAIFTHDNIPASAIDSIVPYTL